MTQKVITPTGGVQDAADAITLTMKYNKGNQLTQMSHGKDSLTYAYDKNGNMTQKALRSKAYGKLTDSYAYNAQDMLTGYSGYDGFTQVFTYDASGMRLTKQEAGNENRSTLEELLRGEVAGLPEVVAPSAEAAKVNPGEVLEGYEWATTEYLYDITAEYYQVIGETVKDKNGSTTTAYAYGIERIAAYGAEETTHYVYDGRGSVVQGILTTPEAPMPQVQSYAYTAFGEQLGGVKVSGFTYNAEAYDAKTGMLNLRARQYEPAMGRFSQKDIFRGNRETPLSQNRYIYVNNNAPNAIDPSGNVAKVITEEEWKANVQNEIDNRGVANYNADAAVGYALEYAEIPNPAYPFIKNLNNGSGQGNCSNYVSQCLVAGGFPRDPKIIDGRITNRYWAYADKNATGLINSKFVDKKDVITITNDDGNIMEKYEELVKSGQILPGDVMYIDYRGNSAYEHAAMITGVTYDEISYSANAPNVRNVPIGEYLENKVNDPSSNKLCITFVRVKRQAGTTTVSGVTDDVFTVVAKTKEIARAVASITKRLVSKS